jgi:hypothetical protein
MAIDKINATALLDGGVTTADIADDAVTSAKIDSTSTGMSLADLAVDTDTLYVDATNDRVGINRSSPSVPLDVRGTSATDLISGLFTTTSAGPADDTNTIFIGCEGNTERGATITAKKTNSSGAHQLSIGVSNNSATPVEQVRIDKIGGFYFNSGYGSVGAAYGCRAWVNFDGTGTPAIRGSGNVSSITDSGTGLFYVNFTTAMPDTNFATSALARYVNGTGIGTVTFLDNSPLTTRTSQIVTIATNSNYTVRDTSDVSVAVFR